MLRRFLIALNVLLLIQRSACAELPAIERAVAEFGAELAEQMNGDAAAVTVRVVGRGVNPWEVHEALASEIAAALRTAGREATPTAWDQRLESLAAARTDFNAADVKRIRAAGYPCWVTGALTIAAKSKLQLAVWDVESGKPKWKRSFDIPAEVLSQDANVPELNRKVVEFCRSSLGRPVGDGICATLGRESLADNGAHQPSVYTYGRQLDNNEPLLPGDIVQMEQVRMKSKGFSRSFPHHTAVVEEVRPGVLVVLQQNVDPAGKVVQRDTWPLASIQTGQIIGYRPWTGSSPLPPVTPRRRTPVDVVRKGNAVNLYRMLDRELDQLQGMWFEEEGTLHCNRDTPSRLQIPFAPPEQYTLHLKVKRLKGDDQLAVGLIVGGRQTMLSVDSYHSTCSGLNLVDGQKSNGNPTTYKGAVLPLDQEVALEVHVSPGGVQALADGRKFVDWEGEASRLSLDSRYEFPHADWLFLGAWNTHFSISEYWLDDET